MTRVGPPSWPGLAPLCCTDATEAARGMHTWPPGLACCILPILPSEPCLDSAGSLLAAALAEGGGSAGGWNACDALAALLAVCDEALLEAEPRHCTVELQVG